VELSLHLPLLKIRASKTLPISFGFSIVHPTSHFRIYSGNQTEIFRRFAIKKVKCGTDFYTGHAVQVKSQNGEIHHKKNSPGCGTGRV
jgi:hypothetical protein